MDLLLISCYGGIRLQYLVFLAIAILLLCEGVWRFSVCDVRISCLPRIEEKGQLPLCEVIDIVIRNGIQMPKVDHVLSVNRFDAL